MADITNIFDVKDRLAASLRGVADKRSMSRLEYIESRIFIRTETAQIVPMRLNPAQTIHHNRKRKSKHTLLLKSRRMGFTTYEQADSYAMICQDRNVDVVTLAQDKLSTQKIFRMVSMMHDLNPDKLKAGTDSTTEISYPYNRTSFFIGTAGSRSFGRGGTIHKVHGSEVAFWEMARDRLENLIVGLTQAARQGVVVFETTANGAQGWFYDTFVEAMEGKNLWEPLFYPWFSDPVNVLHPYQYNRDEIIDTITEEEANLVHRHGLNIHQLAWRRNGMMEMKKKFRQEYPGSWEEAFLVSGTTFFETDTILALSRQCRPPIRESGNLTVWKDPEPGRDYIVAADASGGSEGGDFSPAGVLDWETGEQVALLYGKYHPTVFGRKIVDLAKLYNNAIVVPEENNHGHSVINTILNGCRYRNIYYYVNPAERGATPKKTPGFPTNMKTRPVLLDELNEALEERHMLVNDKLFLEQCKVFVDNGSGKYEAASGKHDDLVMMWGIAWQARKQKRKGNGVL